MHFVNKDNTPSEILDILKEAENLRIDFWRKYVENKKLNLPDNKQPSYNEWTNENVRKHLADIFLCTCGYCGRYIGYEEINNKIDFFGQVDHLIPKSKSAEHVYNWKNYIWVCTNCNKKKSEKGYDVDKKEKTILNPCDLNEMKFVDYKKRKLLYKLQR